MAHTTKAMQTRSLRTQRRTLPRAFPVGGVMHKENTVVWDVPGEVYRIKSLLVVIGEALDHPHACSLIVHNPNFGLCLIPLEGARVGLDINDDGTDDAVRDILYAHCEVSCSEAWKAMFEQEEEGFIDLSQLTRRGQEQAL